MSKSQTTDETDHLLASPANAERLRRSIEQTTKRGPADDMWRVDVEGYPISVRGEYAKNHLEQVNRRLAIAKLALHKIAAAFDDDGPFIASNAIEDMKNAQ